MIAEGNTYETMHWKYSLSYQIQLQKQPSLGQGPQEALALVYSAVRIIVAISKNDHDLCERRIYDFLLKSLFFFILEGMKAC